VRYPLRRIFLAALIGLSTAAYALLFGDAGYLQQADLNSETAELERENESLNQEYIALRERIAAAPAAAGRPALAANGPATIIKFETAPPAPDAGAFGLEPGARLNLAEARILFLTAMFFVAVFGYYILRRLERLPGMPHPPAPSRRGALDA
jgi:hypothetical protein